MSRTYSELQRLEAEQFGHHGSSNGENGDRNGGNPARIVPGQLEYEKIRVWLSTPANREGRFQSVMIVACHSGAGATTTSALLAMTLAEGKRRVLLVDNNFRTPAVNGFFRVRSTADAERLPVDGLPPGTAIYPTDRPNLWALTSHGGTACDLDSVDGQVIDSFLTEMQHSFDFVVFDTAPALDFPEAFMLASKVDGVILVVEAEKTYIEQAQRAKLDLERAGARLVGTVLNRHIHRIPRVIRRFAGMS